MSDTSTQRAPLDYPYSLDPTTEGVFLRELAGVLEVALWRAAQIEDCLREVTRTGSLGDLPVDPPYWARKVSGSTRLLGAIEGFLAAFARASLILYPVREAHLGRGTHLRAALGRNHPAIDAFSDRKLRDGWMHLDEDIGNIAVERAGDVRATTVVTGSADRWYTEALQGSVRIVDASRAAVALPRRGIWSVRPYFHECDTLRADVYATLANPYRWVRVGDISGLAFGWTGRPETWMIKALTPGCEIAVTAESYNDAIVAFRSAASGSGGSSFQDRAAVG